MADEKDTAKKPAAKPKAEAKKPAAKKEAAKAAAKPAAKKEAAKKPAAKKGAAKKGAAKKAAAKDAAKPKRGGATAKGKAPAKAKESLTPPVVRAKARYVRVAPRKVRLVADQIRGMHIDDALAILRFSPRSAASDLAKLLDSAAANAENNHDLIADDLQITEIKVDEGPTLRRFQPRALGRATRIDKRTSHISVALTPEEE
jgi:ribosomal protein L22